MNKISATTTLLLSLFFTTSTMADHGYRSHKGAHRSHHDSLHSCLRAASALKEGYYAKVEYLILTHKGVPTYEIEVHDNAGIEWELMCDITSGDIYEIEREVPSATDPLFMKHMKVDKDAAARIALELHPGKLVHTEYEIGDNGDAAYEFDIFERPGVTHKVEVDAATGKITEVAIEKWDIGRETGEE